MISRTCQKRPRSRYSKPWSPKIAPLEPAVDVGELADQAAEDDDREGAEQAEGELALALRLAPGDHRRQEDPGREERGGDKEDRQLHVPGAHEVVGEDLWRCRCRRSRRASAR